MDPQGPFSQTAADALDERDHELRSALSGIEAVARGLNRQHARLTIRQVDELTHAIAAEARRLRTMLDRTSGQPRAFDLADALRPVIACARSSGLEVRSSIPRGIEVEGRREDTAQAALILLDNARKHAAPSAVDVRATVCGRATTLYVEDRGTGVGGLLDERLFERGVRGDGSSGSGLGLYIARRLMVEQGGSLSVSARPGGGASFALAFGSAPSTSHERLRSIPLLSAVVM